MKGLLRANLSAHARRYLATGLAVAISTAFVLALLALGNGMTAALTRLTASEYEGAAVVVSPGRDTPATSEDGQDALLALIPAIEKVEGAGTVAPVQSAYLMLSKDGTRSPLMAEALKPTPFAAPIPEKGALPSTPEGIALDASTAQRLGAAPGDTIEASLAFGENPTTTRLTVSGILETTPMSPSTAVLLPEGLASAADGFSSANRLLIAGDSSVTGDAEEQALAERVSAALSGTGVEVLTADAAREAAIREIANGSSGLTVMLLVFPVISVIVAAIVVASTFRVLLTQRTRELALLRAVGATRRQIRSLLWREALLVGVAASLLGVLLGLLIGWGVLVGFGLLDPLAALAVAASPSAILGAFLLGTLMTLLAGARPALAMGRLTPMEALASSEAETLGSARSHRRLVGAALLLALVGCTGMGVGLSRRGTEAGFLIAFASGMLVLVTMMVAGLAIIPLFARAWGLLGRGTTARIARGNALRNPGRTASTGIAIAIGVTLITMMSVGAASTKATLETELYSHFPYDLTVTATGRNLDEDELSRIEGVEGIDAALAVRGISATLSPEGAQGTGGSEGDRVFLEGIPDLSPVAHAPVEPIPSGIADVSPGIAAEGAALHLCAEGGSCAEFTARVDEDLSGQVRVSADSLEQIAPAAPITGVVVKTSDPDIEAIQSRLVSLDPSYDAWGPALERQVYTKVIDAVLAIVVGLLAVSILVALVGVTNTLGLSVAERTRENGLLRALGMTKRGVQRMLALEALVIALAGSTLGLILGVGFGIVGTYALPLEGIDRTIIEMPWAILAAVAAGSVLAALIASWWPGRRASRTSPVEALATE